MPKSASVTPSIYAQLPWIHEYSPLPNENNLLHKQYNHSEAQRERLTFQHLIILLWNVSKDFLRIKAKILDCNVFDTIHKLASIFDFLGHSASDHGNRNRNNWQTEAATAVPINEGTLLLCENNLKTQQFDKFQIHHLRKLSFELFNLFDRKSACAHWFSVLFFIDFESNHRKNCFINCVIFGNDGYIIIQNGSTARAL